MIRRLLEPRQAIRALRFAGFRWFILGRVAGSPTGQMRQVVQGWLVYQMTGSALALGWVSTARALVMTRTLLQSNSEAGYRGRISSAVTTLSSVSRLSALPAGALADRYGVPLVVGMMAALLIAVYAAVGLLMPRLRKLS